MSIRDLLNANTELVLDPDTGIAEPITHYPAGVVAAGVAVDAIVDAVTAEKDHDRGEGQIVRGVLCVSADLTLTDDDAWLIDGLRYETEFMQKPQYGMRDVHFIRRDARTSTLPGRSRSGR